jgi:DNA-binding response OmpR family regulator
MSVETLNILSIEDNPADARLIQESLADLHGDAFDVETIDRLESAVHRLRTGGIDAALLDPTLPDSIGWDTFDKLTAGARLFRSFYRHDCAMKRWP